MAKSINWFKLNRALHRDIGYFCIGLTLIFAISGIALNHVEDWNPNYDVTQELISVEGISDRIDTENFNAWLLTELKLNTKVKATFWESPKTYKMFTKQNHTLIVNPQENQVVVQQVKPRFLLRRFNFLHLNEARKAWTYFSDFYAVLLIYLALSALFMIKGKKGVWGKRGLLVITGFVIPAIFVALYSS